MDFSACPKCQSTKTWKLKRGKSRCAQCRYDWVPGKFPLRLNEEDWDKIISLFFDGLRSQAIADTAGVERKRVLRALQSIRVAMSKDIPSSLKNLVKPLSLSKNKTKNPLMGILEKEGNYWCEIVQGGDSNISDGLQTLSAWKPYAGIVENGHIKILSKEEKTIRPHPSGPLDNFWAFLKRKLTHKGGVRRERLPLYLAEYSWDFNNRLQSKSDKKNKILELLSAGKGKKFPVLS